MALAMVIKRPILSVYPNANLALPPLMHGLVHPRLCIPATVSPIHIMWSRDNFDNRQGAVFQPNHFVPLVCRDDRKMPLVTKSTRGKCSTDHHIFFPRKPDLSSKMTVGSKQPTATEWGDG